ncbi:MAG: hypothetical protein WBH73_02485 [Arcanobacterium sp.]
MLNFAGMIRKKFIALATALVLAFGVGVSALPSQASAAPGAPSPDAVGKWTCNSAGDCQFKDNNGQLYRNFWALSGGKWYYLKSDGWMARGPETGIDLAQIGSSFYAFDRSGAMLTGWQSEKRGSSTLWYYFAADGRLLSEEKAYINGSWYIFGDPTLVTDYMDGYLFEGKEYRIPSSGAVVTGWYQEGTDWYYYGSDGAMYEEQWLQYNGKWYYFDANGIMLANTVRGLPGGNYYFDASGAMYTGWEKDVEGAFTFWYYYGSNGVQYQDKWLYDNNKWYYFDIHGPMADSGCRWTSGTARYCFDSSGAMRSNGWYLYYGDWVYLGPSGNVYFGWHKIGGKWYYLDPDSNGEMVTGEFTIGSTTYVFDSSGAWTGRAFPDK